MTAIVCVGPSTSRKKWTVVVATFPATSMAETISSPGAVVFVAPNVWVSEVPGNDVIVVPLPLKPVGAGGTVAALR